MTNRKKGTFLPRLELLEERRLLAAAAAPGQNPYWGLRYKELVEHSGNDARVVLLGDSILDNLRPGMASWDSQFASMGVSNFAIGTSTAANVRWQVESGQLDGLRPEIVVLLVGTNDLQFHGASASDTVDEITASVRAIQNRFPESQVLLVGILPRGASASDPFRMPIAEINYELNLLQLANGYVFVDVGERFLSADGSISAERLWDYVHPTSAGYEILASGSTEHLHCMLSAAHRVSTEIQTADLMHSVHGTSNEAGINPDVWNWLITAEDDALD